MASTTLLSCEMIKIRSPKFITFLMLHFHNRRMKIELEFALLRLQSQTQQLNFK